MSSSLAWSPNLNFDMYFLKRKIWAAWADRITFEEIEKKTGKTEAEVIKIMRHSIKPVSFRLWRKRVNQKSIKHRKKFEYSRKEITSKINKNDYL